MIIDWINVEKQLPLHGQRCLAKCRQQISSDVFWMGIIDVIFDFREGWIRCEGEVRDVRVLKWIAYPENENLCDN